MSRNHSKSDLETTFICNFPISTNTLQGNYEYLLKNIKNNTGKWVVTLNLEMIFKSNTDNGYNQLIQGADLFIADGVPLIWASQKKHEAEVIKGRSNGTDLVEKLLQSSDDLRVGIVGGTNPEKALEKINSDLLEYAFIFDGKVKADDDELIDFFIEKFEKHNTQVLFLGLGVPKQDIVAKKIRDKIDSLIIIGVGGAFDLLSGRKSRAPLWMQNNGLEWMHRLMTEPKRLWKRYLINYPRASYYLLKDIYKN